MASDCIELDSSHPAGPKEHVSLWSKSQSPFHRLGGRPMTRGPTSSPKELGLGGTPLRKHHNRLFWPLRAISSPGSSSLRPFARVQYIEWSNWLNASVTTK